MTDSIARQACEESAPPGVLEHLASGDRGDLERRLAKAIQDRGVTFGEGEFLLDPVPRMIAADEWQAVEAGLSQRIRALNSFVVDVYNEGGRILDAGVVPRRVIETADYYEPELEGRMPEVPIAIAGLDLVRDRHGRLLVLEDNARTPSGFAYAVVARELLDEFLPAPDTRRDPAEVFELLAAALRGAAPPTVDDPHIVLVTDGPANSAWYEHQLVAEKLGLPIARPDELERRGDELLLNGRRVDVVYRRTDDDELASETGNKLAGATVVNAFGTGLADDKLVHAYVERMIGFYLDEEPLIGSVRSYDLGDEQVLESLLDRMDELVVKPRSASGGEAVHVGPHADAADHQRFVHEVRANPDQWIAQETIALSQHPTVWHGEIALRHIDLRAFVFASPQRVTVMPGGLTRVALDPGSLVVNSSQGGGAKDTWVMAPSP
jgi:uncharacterized circularly permuted ATP-grasp superfamily protein